MTRQEQRIGKAGEGAAARALAALGICMVERIGTPVRLIPHGRYFAVIWGEWVSGDHRGVLPGGRSVLAETKTALDRNLRWSDLRAHQPQRLSRHAELGGLSLLVWVHESRVHESRVYVMQWPIEGFERGAGITVKQGEIEHEKTRVALVQYHKKLE